MGGSTGVHRIFVGICRTFSGICRIFGAVFTDSRLRDVTRPSTGSGQREGAREGGMKGWRDGREGGPGSE